MEKISSNSTNSTSHLNVTATTSICCSESHHLHHHLSKNNGIIDQEEDHETPEESGGGDLDGRGVDCVRVCVMMVEQQKNEKLTFEETPEGGEAVVATVNTNGSVVEKRTRTPSSSPVKKRKIDTSGSTPAASTPASLFNLSPEILKIAPLLVGKYYVQDQKAVWTGKWGMNESAFGVDGVTSPFEMKSDENVVVRTCSGEAPTCIHPAMYSSPMARSWRLENDKTEEVNPIFWGYETRKEELSAMPFSSKYSGNFQIQAMKGKNQTIAERQVEINFVHDVTTPSQFIVSGSGENRFGKFSLFGTLNKEANEMRLYKIYQPKEKKPPVVKRGRTPRAASARVAVTTQKLQTRTKKAPPAPLKTVADDASSAVAVTPSPVVPAVMKLDTTANSSAAQSAVSTPMSDASLVRGRSERKRVIPAHLREEAVAEPERVPASLRKCHSILKTLIANPRAVAFLAPVDPVALGIPDYFDVIKEPMDLGTIRHNVECGYYSEPSVFADHVRLVFSNAMLYNAAHSQVHQFAAKLSEDFEKRITIVLEKHAVKAARKEKGKKERKGSGTSLVFSTESFMQSAVSKSKVKGGKGAKGNTKRRVSAEEQGVIASIKEEIERLKATIEQLQPIAVQVATPKPTRAPSKPFRMEDLTEEELSEPMTQMEKARLSADIRRLPQDKINRVLQIIAEAVPVAKLANDNDEVELDINALDTRCLRMLEGYVRENGIGRKRKRTVKPPKAKAANSRLKSAKIAATNIRQRKQQLKNQLAAIDGGAVPQPAVPAKNEEVDSSSDSSSSSSSSSDSESDSDSDSDSDSGAPLERSPSLFSAPALSSISETSSTSIRPDSAKKIRDEAVSSQPLKVENRGAWSLLAKKETTASKTPGRSDENGGSTSSLWLSARSMEQMKQQKLQQQEKERTEEIEAHRKREMVLREKEKEREIEEMMRLKKEQEEAARLAEEEQLRTYEAEKARASQRAVQREKMVRDVEQDDTHEHALTEDLESFSSSSFL